MNLKEALQVKFLQQEYFYSAIVEHYVAFSEQ